MYRGYFSDLHLRSVPLVKEKSTSKIGAIVTERNAIKNEYSISDLL